MEERRLSLYLHIPFCTLKCSYCDFNSYAGLESLVRPYVDALIQEMGLWRQATRGWQVPTVFFGGGTPSLLPIRQVERIVSAFHDNFDVTPDCEVSLEANPGTVDLDYLRGLLALGVNRLSFGVQSFHDDELVALDRIHSAEEARQAYRWARQAGFQRLNLDLIYGLSQQPLSRWQASLEEAIALGPDHLSLYALTVEEGTKLAYDIVHGRVAEPDADAQAEMYEWSQERMTTAGYEHYEISNWARPGQRCRHNLTYWENRPYLALGAGAHSYLPGNKEQGTRNTGYRFADVYSPRQYIRGVEETVGRGPPPGEDMRSLLQGMRQVAYVEEATPELAMADTLIMGLRLIEGISLAEFRRRFGVEVTEAYEPQVTELEALGLLERAPSTGLPAGKAGSGQAFGRLRLTPRGLLLGNEVFLRFLPE